MIAQFRSMKLAGKMHVFWCFFFLCFFIANSVEHWIVAWFLDLPMALFYMAHVWVILQTQFFKEIREALVDAQTTLLVNFWVACLERGIQGDAYWLRDRDSMPEFYRHGL